MTTFDAAYWQEKFRTLLNICTSLQDQHTADRGRIAELEELLRQEREINDAARRVVREKLEDKR